MTPEPTQIEPRKHKACRRYNDAGHAHALTFSCFHRQAFLSRNRTRRWLIDAIEQLTRSGEAIDPASLADINNNSELRLWYRSLSPDRQLS